MLTLLLFILASIHNSSFIEYYAIYHFYSVNETLYGYIIEDNISLFPNDTVSYDFYQISLNDSKYIGPIHVYNNFSSPTSLYIFQDVGENVVFRGNSPYVLIGESNGYYIYQNVQYVTSVVSVVSYYYVNQSGVPYKIIFLQYYERDLVSNTTFVLYSTNVLNINQKVYFPLGLERVGQTFSLSNSFDFTVQDFIFSSLLVFSAIVFFVKYYNRNKGKKID